MGKKAVYSNKGLQVYITGEDFEALLKYWSLDVPVFVGKVPLKNCRVTVKTQTPSNSALLRALTLERDAINQARNEAFNKLPKY